MNPDLPNNQEETFRMSANKNYANLNNVGEGEDSPQIGDKKMKLLPNGKLYTELRISSPRFKFNHSHNLELKLLSASHKKLQMNGDASLVGRSSAMKDYCEGTIDNSRPNQRISYSQLMLQTFSKLPHQDGANIN